jgi:hypothetical protein
LAIQQRADKAYEIWAQNPNAPGLRFKRVSRTHPIYSVRIGNHYRALGLLQEDTLVWFWIGSHAEYDGLLRQK